MATVSQPKLQIPTHLFFLPLHDVHHPMPVLWALVVQSHSNAKTHRNIPNVLQVVFWRASPSWNTRFDETFPTKASSLPYGAISVMARQYDLSWPLIPPPPLTSQFWSPNFNLIYQFHRRFVERSLRYIWQCVSDQCRWAWRCLLPGRTTLHV